MATYWLKPAAAGGDDANDGDSPLEAWASWGKAAQRLWLPGDRLVVAGAFPGIAGAVELKGGGDAVDPVVVEGNGGALSFAAGLADAPKFVVCGDGFLVQDLEVTQATKGSNPADRLVVAQPSQDGQHAPRDVTFRRIVAHNSYEPLKASGVVRRIRFEQCESYDAEIAAGIAGAADDCAFVGCLFRGFRDGVQTKGGARNPRVEGCTVVGDAADGFGITLGGSSAIDDGTDPPWWRDEGYESANAVAVANLVIGVPGGTLWTGIAAAGALDPVAVGNTVVGLPGTAFWTDGIGEAWGTRTSGGSGWAGGPPTTRNARFVGNVAVRAAAATATAQAPGGSNVERDCTFFDVEWLTDDSGGNGMDGDWTISGRSTADPRLALWAGVTDWRELDARLRPGSPARLAAGAALVEAFGGEPMPVGRDFHGNGRGDGPWDRGAFDESARNRRQGRRRKWRRAA